MPDFVSFNEFIDRTADAKPGQYIQALRASAVRGTRGVASPSAAAAAVSDDDREAEFAKMKQYVLDHYKGVSCSHTFLDAGGNAVDCVPYEEQPAYQAAKRLKLKLPKKPPAPTGPKGRARGKAKPAAARAARGRAAGPVFPEFGPEPTPVIAPLRQGHFDPLGNPIACPEDHVPLGRISLPRLALMGKLENFFLKDPGIDFGGPSAAARGEAPGPDGRLHRHAFAEYVGGGRVVGCSAWMNVWGVSPSPGAFHLSQLWLVGTKSAGHPDTIESGWMVSPGLWNTSLPVIFIYFNPAGYDFSRGGWFTNPQGVGFIRRSSAWPLGIGINQFSSLGGNQAGFQMWWEQQENGDWWLYMGTSLDDILKGDPQQTAVGVFPGGLYNNTALAAGANVVHFGGEVGTEPNDPRTGVMGSGRPPFQPPESGFGQVAFQKDILIQTKIRAQMKPATLQTREPSAPNYRAAVGSSANWNSYLFYGGPGAP